MRDYSSVYMQMTDDMYTLLIGMLALLSDSSVYRRVYGYLACVLPRDDRTGL